jgi:hypothetical protein
VGERGRRLGAAAPEERADPGHQLGEGERLHQVVVGARVEAQHPILHRVSGGQDEHRELPALRAERPQDLDPAAAGQHEVEQHEIEPLAAGQEEALLAVRGDPDLVPLGREPVGEGPRHLPLVFHDEDTHGVSRAADSIGAAPRRPT